jgi:preprotein translocase subunit SecA
MDYLREGIGLRAMAQRDPLVEYKNEGAQMDDAMFEAFQEEVVGFLFNQDIKFEAPERQRMELNVEPVGVEDLLEAELRTPEVAEQLRAVRAELEHAGVGASASRSTGSRTVGGPGGSAVGTRSGASGGFAAPAAPRAARAVNYSAPDESGKATATRTLPSTDPYAGVGRNEPCPCGSGKKYKRCHG